MGSLLHSRACLSLQWESKPFTVARRLHHGVHAGHKVREVGQDMVPGDVPNKTGMVALLVVEADVPVPERPDFQEVYDSSISTK